MADKDNDGREARQKAAGAERQTKPDREDESQPQPPMPAAAREANRPASAPAVEVTATLTNGDERHGLELLVNGVNTPQDNRHKVAATVDYDADVTIRHRDYPPKAEDVPSPAQRHEAEEKS